VKIYAAKILRKLDSLSNFIANISWGSNPHS